MTKPLLNGMLLATLFLLAACGAVRNERATSPDPDNAARGEAETAQAQDGGEAMESIMAGEFALQDGRTASAAKHYLRAAELGADPKIAAQAMRIALAAKQWELAARAAERWEKLEPESQERAILRNGILLGQGKSDQVYKVLKPLLDSVDSKQLKYVGQVLMLGEPGDSAKLLKRFLEAGKISSHVKSYILLSQVADQILQRKLSLALAEAALKQFPDKAEAYVWKGHLLLKEADKKGAEASLKKAMALAPDNVEVRLTYAALLNEQGLQREAVQILDGIESTDEVMAAKAAYAVRSDDADLMKLVYRELQALSMPHPAARLELLGQMAELLKLNEEARAWYAQVPQGEHYLGAQLRQAVLLDETGKTAEALQVIAGLRDEGIEDDTRLVDTFLLEAELLIKHDRQEEALETYNTAIRILAKDKRLRYARALILEKMDRVPASLEDLRALLALDPSDPDALNALGYTLADRTDQFQEALGFIQKALETKPEDAAILDSMGWVLHKLGKDEEALAYLEKAFAKQPDAEIAAHYGEVLWLLDRKGEAKRVWEKGKTKDPANKNLIRTMEKFIK